MSSYSILKLGETQSTSTYLKQLLQEKPLVEGFVVCADYQSGGRGQRGNRWESEAGLNLLFSVVLYPKQIVANAQFVISQLVSLSIKEVLDQYTSDISIKWPNDIYWKDKKIAGILIENSITDGSIDHSIIGIGLNLNQTAFMSDAPNPVSLKNITNETYDLDYILDQILERIFYYYNQLPIISNRLKDRYKTQLYRNKGFYTYSDTDENFKAQILDVEDSGLLVLKLESGEIRKFAFKEVKYLI